MNIRLLLFISICIAGAAKGYTQTNGRTMATRLADFYNNGLLLELGGGLHFTKVQSRPFSFLNCRRIMQGFPLV